MIALWWLAAQTAAANAPVDYFPPEMLAARVACSAGGDGWKNAALTKFEAQWFSKQLQIAKEPSLSQPAVLARAAELDTIRFTWLRSFHPAIVVRIEGLTSPAPRIIAKRRSDGSDRAEGDFAAALTRNLTAAEAQSLRAVLADTRFGRSSTAVPRAEACGLRGLDGAQWLVETVDDRGYRFDKEWSPKEGDIRRMGLALLGLTGWTIDPIY